MRFRPTEAGDDRGRGPVAAMSGKSHRVGNAERIGPYAVDRPWAGVIITSHPGSRSGRRVESGPVALPDGPCRLENRRDNGH
jgi:hypothetical protein